MKKLILICPDACSELDEIIDGIPIPLAHYIGKPLIEHALDGYSRLGITDILLLVSDRPSDVRAYVEDGAAWGLKLQISPEARELSVSEAQERYAAFGADAIHTLRALPQANEQEIIKNAQTWHQSRASLLPLIAKGVLGAREISEGIWCGMKTVIHPTAILIAPCWIGQNVQISAHTRIGPNAFIENHTVIDTHAIVENSSISPRTYLGSMASLMDSIATGDLLLNWKNGSQTRICDSFLLSRLDPPQQALSSPFGRLSAFILLMVFSPLALLAVCKKSFVLKHEAVLPSEPGASVRSISYYVMPFLPGYLQRWPQLWRVVTGHFTWVGNPPLNQEEASALEGEFERLWLSVGPGIFTAPEAEGCRFPWDDAARAHAALFATQPSARWKRKIIFQAVKTLFS